MKYGIFFWLLCYSFIMIDMAADLTHRLSNILKFRYAISLVNSTQSIVHDHTLSNLC